MQKLIKSVFLTLLLLVPVVSILSINYFSYMGDDDNNGPWVTYFDDKVGISWELEAKHSGKVSYGLDEENLTNEKATDGESLIQHVTLDGLDAGKKYFYKVTVDDREIGSGSFTTSSNSDEDFSMVFIADAQQPKIAAGGYPRVAQAISKGDHAFVAIVGDFVDKGELKANYNNFFKNTEQYSNRIPLVPVIGNHDNHDDGPWFRQYFKNNGDRELFFYSFDYNMVHLAIMQFTWARDSEFSDEQMDWIKQDLQNAQDSKYRIVMFHCPAMGAGFYNYNTNLMTRLVPILEEYNVTAVFSGHEHHYDRTIHNEITYFVVGTGGGIQDPGLRPLNGTRALSAVPGYTVLNSTADGLYFQTLTHYGAIIDSGRIA